MTTTSGWWRLLEGTVQRPLERASAVADSDDD